MSHPDGSTPTTSTTWATAPTAATRPSPPGSGGPGTPTAATPAALCAIFLLLLVTVLCHDLMLSMGYAQCLSSSGSACLELWLWLWLWLWLRAAPRGCTTNHAEAKPRHIVNCRLQVANDWTTVVWRKPDYLETVGLQPFYAQYRPSYTPAPVGHLTSHCSYIM